MIKEQETPQEKRPPLPTLRINRNERIVAINGQIVQFQKYSIAWQVFLFLASKPNTDIDGLEIKSVEGKAGSRKRDRGISFIENLRKLIKDDYHNPRILIKTGRIGKNYGRYRLNARIEFTEESLSPKKPKKERRAAYMVDLKKEQEEIMRALFSINPQRNGYENTRTKDAVMDIYGSRLFAAIDPGERRRETRWCYSSLNAIRNASMEKLRRNWNKPPEQRLPKIREFIKWLKEQPEYANATLEDLELVARRKISFEELKKKAVPVPVEKQIFPENPVPPHPASAVKKNPPIQPPPSPQTTERSIKPMRLAITPIKTVESPIGLPVLTHEEIFVLAFNFLRIKERSPELLEKTGVILVRYDNDVERLCQSLKVDIEKNRKAVQVGGGMVFDRKALAVSLRGKLEVFKRDPWAFFKANKTEARILLNYLVNLEKEKLAVLLSALCP